MECLWDSDVVVLEVRPEEEYRAGHVPGALSAPVDTLEATLQTLPKDREVIAYCRGPYCVFSDEAVKFLEACGYRASRLVEGFPEWRAAGGCQWRAKEDEVSRESVDAKTLREWLERGEWVTAVDVRHADEHAEWFVSGSVNLDVYDKLKAGDHDAMEGLNVPKDGPVVTVCGARPRRARASGPRALPR